MKVRFLLLLTLLCLPTLAAALPSTGSRSQPAPCNPWPRTLAPLKIGTTRTEAEKTLALAHARLLFIDRWGSGQSDTYRLDSHWTVTVSYDYSSPQNKVTSLPVFVQEDEKKR